jgi:hypothetical protein
VSVQSSSLEPQQPAGDQAVDVVPAEAADHDFLELLRNA